MSMKKVYIWGTGKKARNLVNNCINAEIIGYIETNRRQKHFCEKKVYLCTEIEDDYDAIVVANVYSNEIYLTSNQLGIDIDRMIFMKPCSYVEPRTNLEWVESILGYNNYQIYLSEYGLIDKTFIMQDIERYNERNHYENFVINRERLFPVIKERFETAGTVGNYFWQDLWAARLIYERMPREHYDIGSRLDGFIAHILAFGVPVKMIDIRPFPVEVEGLTTIVDDATALDEFEDDSIESLSALCSLEHFGLGRYGDPIDPEACFKCFNNIQKRMKPGGNLYISVPIGKERLEFNAHRVFYPQTIIDSFDKMKLVEFSCTADGYIERDVDIHKYDEDDHHGDYRYGLFYFIKE